MVTNRIMNTFDLASESNLIRMRIQQYNGLIRYSEKLPNEVDWSSVFLEKTIHKEEWDKSIKMLLVLLNWLDMSDIIKQEEKNLEPNDEFSPRKTREKILGLISQIQRREAWENEKNQNS